MEMTGKSEIAAICARLGYAPKRKPTPLENYFAWRERKRQRYNESKKNNTKG